MKKVTIILVYHFETALNKNERIPCDFMAFADLARDS